MVERHLVARMRINKHHSIPQLSNIQDRLSHDLLPRYLCVAERNQRSVMLSSTCVFCRIISVSTSSNIIVEEEKAIAFLDAFPLSKGHTLVIPKLHFFKIQDMSEGYESAVFHLMHRLVGPIEKAAHVESSLIAIHNGKEAGQEIDHVHIHIVPRTAHDGAGPIHSMFIKRPSISSSDLNQMAIAIRKEL